MQSGPVVLVVEDDEADVMVTRRALRAAHLANEIVAVHDGVEALEWLFCEGSYSQRDPARTPALILLDLRMPRLDGFALLKRLRADERTRNIPAIVVTGSISDEDRAKSVAEGASGFLAKPFVFSELVAATRHLTLSWMLVNGKAASQHGTSSAPPPPPPV